MKYVILLLPLIQEGLLSVTSISMFTEYCKLTQRLTDRHDMTICIDWDVKLQTKHISNFRERLLKQHA